MFYGSQMFKFVPQCLMHILLGTHQSPTKGMASYCKHLQLPTYCPLHGGWKDWRIVVPRNSIQTADLSWWIITSAPSSSGRMTDSMLPTSDADSMLPTRSSPGASALTCSLTHSIFSLPCATSLQTLPQIISQGNHRHLYPYLLLGEPTSEMCAHKQMGCTASTALQNPFTSKGNWLPFSLDWSADKPKQLISLPLTLIVVVIRLKK